MKVVEGLSEQGEQEAAKQSILWASTTETENWVAEAKKDHPERMICKRRGRHEYENNGLTFVGITKDNLWVRRRPCHDCHGKDEQVNVERVEMWLVKQHRGKIRSAELVVAYPNYLVESYLNKGAGRMKTRGILSAEMTLDLRGQGFRDFRKGIILASAPQLPELVNDQTAALDAAQLGMVDDTA